MSQQHMASGEIYHDRESSSHQRFEGIPHSEDYYTGSYGQKISAVHIPSIGQRLVPAIVSFILLALVTFGVTGIGFLANVGLPGALLFLTLLISFYAAVAIIHVQFNPLSNSSNWPRIPF